MCIDIRSIAPENKQDIMSLRIKPSQNGMVESVQECLSDTIQHPEYQPVALYYDDSCVGFAMYGEFSQSDHKEVWLDRLLIDKHYQGKGLGRESLNALMDRLEDQYDCDTIYLSVYSSNAAAIRLYETSGFRFNGERDINGELVMTRNM